MSLFRAAFGAYVQFRIRRGLDGVWVRGLDHARAALDSGPVVFAANHVSWWDAMLMFPLDDALGRSSRVWMDAKNLKKHPFFRSLGALPLDDSGPAALRRSVREASAWLVAPRRSLWVFPQGRYVPSWIRPLELRPGAMFIARRTKAKVVPVGLAYGFRQGPTPAAVVSFGAPVDPDDVEAGLLRELAATDGFLTGDDPTFQPLLSGVTAGTEQSLAARALSLVVRA